MSQDGPYYSSAVRGAIVDQRRAGLLPRSGRLPTTTCMRLSTSSGRLAPSPGLAPGPMRRPAAAAHLPNRSRRSSAVIG